MSPLLKVSELSFHSDTARPLLSQISFELKAGESLGVIGPNGAGKSTLIRLLSLSLQASQGQIELKGRSLQDYSAQERAQSMALVHPRENLPPFPLKVLDYLRLGRAPFQNQWGQWQKRDQAALEQAVERCRLQAYLESPLHQLSSGEWQRVQLGRALTQSPQILLLDEPTAHLDIGAQIEIFQLLKRLCQEGLCLIAVIHDLNLAAQYMQFLLFLEQGQTRALGTPSAVLTPQRLEAVYGLKWSHSTGTGRSPAILIPDYGQD